MKPVRLVVVCVALLVAHQGVAMFRASSVVVVPVVASTAGLHGSNWHTDLDILNVDTNTIDVRIALLPSGGNDNQAWLDDLSNQLGWSADFGHVLPPSDSSAATSPLEQIAPGQLVRISDVLSYFNLGNVKGALVVFAYQTGTFVPGNPAAAAPATVVVTSRTYTLSQTSSGNIATYGQEVPGLPWYGFTGAPDPSAGLSRLDVTGIREDSAYRTSVGLVNLSNRLTTLEVTLSASDGSVLGDLEIAMQPYAHVQFDQAVRSLFGLTADAYPSVVGATLTAAAKTWSPSVQAGDATPQFVAYASRIDNESNDPVYLEPSYRTEFPWDCAFNGLNCPSQQPPPAALAMFRAASLEVVPVSASTLGLDGSNWHTDLQIRNVDSVPVDVEIVFLPTGGTSNASWYFTFANALGGRSSDGFTHLDAGLTNIPPGGTAEIDDIVNTYWGSSLSGALLIWAYEANSFTATTPNGGYPRDIVVTSRTYSVGTAADGSSTTYGQEVPGLPWYDYIDPNLVDKGYSQAVFTGVGQGPSVRASVGFLNVSDILTSVDIEMILKQTDGTLLADLGISLYALSHVQYDSVVAGLFGLATTAVLDDSSLTVKVISWNSTANEPTPALIAYVNRIDNFTNDPVYIEQAWASELSWQCVFTGDCASAMALRAGGAVTPRPLRPPTP
jgi:hypothetical protein